MMSNPISICLAYLLVYCVFGYFIYNLDSKLQMLEMDGVPNCNPRVRYGKGRYKYTTSRPTRKSKRKGRYKPPPKKKGYTRRPKYFGGWQSEHKWKPLLDCDYSNYFHLYSECQPPKYLGLLVYLSFLGGGVYLPFLLVFLVGRLVVYLYLPFPYLTRGLLVGTPSMSNICNWETRL